MKLTKKTAAIGVCVLFAVLMLPVVITCFYTYPVLDDYNFSVHSHWAVLDGESVPVAAVKNAYSFYMNWQGAYASNLVAGIQPFVWNVHLYFLSAFFMLFSSIAAFLIFFHALCRKVLDLSKETWLLTVGIGLILFWELIPSIAEGLYWMDGAQNILFLCYFYIGAAAVIYYHGAGGRTRTLWATLASVVTILLGGADFEIVTCYCLCTAACLLLPQIRKSSTMKLVLLQLGLLAVGLTVNFLSPGTFVRTDGMEGMPIAKAIVMAIYYGFVFFARWMRIPVLGGLVLICAAAWPELKRCRYDFRWPLVAAVLCFGFYCGAISVVLAGKGSSGDPRQENYFYLNFIMSMIVLSLYLTGWVAKRFPQFCVRNTVRLTACTVAVMLAGTILTVNVHKISTVDTAWGLYKGYTQRYGREMQARIDILENQDITDAVLEPLTLHPAYLIPEQLSEGPDFWTNQSVAAYYRKNSVRLMQEDMQ